MWKLLVNRKTTNICVFGVGANPDYSWSSKYFIKYFLKNINHIYVRDPYSAEVLKKHFQVDPDITHDAAYYMNHSSKPELNDQRIGVGIVCKSVYDYYNSPLSVSEYYRLYEKALSEFQKKEICLIYSTPEDRRECLKFQKYYNKCHNRNIPIIENDTVEELLSNIGSLSTIVAGRMHLLIAGQLSNTTVIPVEISNKIRVYNDLKNQESVKTKRNIVTNDFTKLISDLRNLINDDN